MGLSIHPTWEVTRMAASSSITVPIFARFDDSEIPLGSIEIPLRVVFGPEPTDLAIEVG